MPLYPFHVTLLIRRRLTKLFIRISSSAAAGRARLAAAMRLLTVTLFFVILHHIRAAEIKSLPVDSRTSSAIIQDDHRDMKRSCVDAAFLQADGTTHTVDGNNCKIGLNNRYIVAVAGGLQFQSVGYCQNKIFTCEHDEQSKSRICKHAAARDVTNLKANDAAFTDSDLCAIQVVDNRQNAQIRSRYKQEVFTQHLTDGSFVQTAANYLQDLPYQVEVARDNDRLVLGDTFDYGKTKSEDCGHTCGYGAHMEFQNVAINQRFLIDLYPKSTCSWIAICFKYTHKGCNEKYRLVLLLDHDIVLPQSYNSAIKMKLRDARHIRVERPNDDNLEKYMYIVADTHDRIVLDAVNTDKKMAIMTSDHECFEAPMKSSLGMIAVAEAPQGKNPKTKGNVDLSKVKTSGIKDVDYDKKNNRTAAKTTMDEYKDPTTVSEMIFTQTAGASTTELTYKPPEINSIEMAKTDETNSSTKASQEGWLTWAYFYGALSGSTFGFIVCGVLFFLCRRSIYGDWYRGMYKRYGCDASGTTGGVTGAEFGTTTGGNTTIGATTAGATATSATTGGDTTSNSAMSGTSGASGTGQSTMITM